MTLSLRYAARSDVGLLRDGNEDSLYAGPRLLAVADGMGGHAAGEVASAVVIAALAPLDDDVPPTDLLGALRAALATANDELQDMAETDGALEGMGTTVTAVLTDGGRLGLAHIGDSRAYLLRDNRLELITRDHTFVQSLVDEGRITAEEADHHPQRSLLTRALDGRDAIEPDLSVREVRAGDRYLLCTDGLSGVVSEETIRATLATGDPRTAVDRLVDLALRGGGPDNVSCVVADVVEDGEPADEAPLVGGAAARVNGLPAEEAAPGDSPAARAAAAPGGAREHVQPEDIPAPRGRRRGRGGRGGAASWRGPLLVVLLVLAVVGAVAGAGLAYARSQYYVALDRGEIVIFRGVEGSVGGVRLSQVHERTGVAAAALSAFERERVEQGIEAGSLRRARSIAARLREQACGAPRPPTVRPPVRPPTGAAPRATRPRPAPAPTPTPTRPPCLVGAAS
ncbi:MAG TPA: PP2C family serine/threonine-protein phosphatase [Mycobacteriales bacterium]|nr:PP2C family serine/threonine-protein phosphatase [Mycobacteriales bacterium]